MKIKTYIKLMRPKHYLKNFLIFLPLVFGGVLFETHYLLKGIYSFAAFSMVASAVYIFNDIKDKNYDKKHSKKKHRPLAAGVISIPSATAFAVVLLGVAAIFQTLSGWQLTSAGLLLLYLATNISYSFGLKNLPIIDVAIISLGFVLRVIYGGYSVGIGVSKWLYLAILAFSFYLGLGKRRNEIKVNGHDTRKVNQHYNQEFLDKNMYVCFALTIVYYSLWAIDPAQQHKHMYLTIPLVLIIAMLYSLTVESMDSDGDPISVLLGNKTLLALAVFYAALVTFLVYI
jgi:decaprenyl-phosphate phosphoribosyltransferase